MIRNWKIELSHGREGRVMRLSLAVSLLIHVVLFLSLQRAFPIPWLTQTLRTYQVELIRPPVEDLGKEAVSHAEIGPVHDEPPTPPSEDQETITLDTQDRRYVNYARAIKERLILHWRYPAEAKRNLVEGKLSLVFGLSRNGRLDRVDILQPSGFPILDEEALRTVRAAAPFPAFPEHVRVSRLNIQVSFDYRITAKK